MYHLNMITSKTIFISYIVNVVLYDKALDLKNLGYFKIRHEKVVEFTYILDPGYTLWSNNFSVTTWSTHKQDIMCFFEADSFLDDYVAELLTWWVVIRAFNDLKYNASVVLCIDEALDHCLCR